MWFFLKSNGLCHRIQASYNNTSFEADSSAECFEVLANLYAQFPGWGHYEGVVVLGVCQEGLQDRQRERQCFARACFGQRDYIAS